MRVRKKFVVITLWCSLGRAIFAGRKNDSPDFSLSCYCTDLERLTFPEEGGIAAIVEEAVHISKSNENKNSEEGAGWEDIKRAVLSEEGGTAETLEGAVSPYNSNADDNENSKEGGTAATV